MAKGRRTAPPPSLYTPMKTKFDCKANYCYIGNNIYALCLKRAFFSQIINLTEKL